PMSRIVIRHWPRTRSAGPFEGLAARRAAELLDAALVLEQHRVVHPAGRTLPGQNRVDDVPVLAGVGRLPGLADLPGILGPDQFAAAFRAGRRAGHHVL